MRKTIKRQKSYLQKALEKAAESTYIEAIDSISDNDVKKSVFPKVTIPIGNGMGRSFACDDACNVSLSSETCEYNGPIPLGYMEVPPSMLPMNGIIGKILKHYAARNFFLGDQVNGWFRQNCFIYKACNMPGEDAVACGFKVVPRGTKDKKSAQEFMDYVTSESFNIKDSMREFDCNKRCYGGAFLIPCFEEDVDMSAPLYDWGQLKGKTFIGWTNLEPYNISPEFDPNSRELNDPTYKNYMVPSRWNVYGSNDGSNFCKSIHSSWIFFRRNVITTRIYRPMYKFLGPSIPQMIIERLYSAEVCANESSMLLRSKRKFAIECDIRKLAANPQYAEKFFKNMNVNADNWNVCALPRNSNAKQMDTYLSECMPLTTAQYGILCAEVEIPAPKFMMAQLTGFANSGNYEIKLYANNIRKLIDDEMTPIVKRTAMFYNACKTGKPDAVDVQWGDIDIPTITEQAEIAYEKARAEKFVAEAKAVGKLNGAKSAETHKTALEREKKEK